MSERSYAGGGGGFARVASLVAAGKRLATASSSKHSNPSKSFRFNDNGSMVDLHCQDHAGTFQRRGDTLSENPKSVGLQGPEIGVDHESRLQLIRQCEAENWSNSSGYMGRARPPTAEQLLAPGDGDTNSFRMWTPHGETECNCRSSDTEYETTPL